MKIFKTLILFTFLSLLSNNSHAQFRLFNNQSVDTIFFKNGNKIIGTYDYKSENRMKICKEKSTKDCKIYNQSELSLIKKGYTKEEIRTNEKIKKKIAKGKRTKRDLVRKKIYRFFKFGDEYWTYRLDLKGKNFDFYIHSEHREHGASYQRMIVTEPNYGKRLYFFTNYSSRKKLFEIFADFNCPTLEKAIKNKQFRLSRPKNVFYEAIDECKN